MSNKVCGFEIRLLLSRMNAGIAPLSRNGRWNEGRVYMPGRMPRGWRQWVAKGKAA